MSFGEGTSFSAQMADPGNSIGPNQKAAFYGGVVNIVNAHLSGTNPNIKAADLNDVIRTCPGGSMRIWFSPVALVTSKQVNNLERALKHMGAEVAFENSDVFPNCLVVSVDMKKGLDFARRKQAARNPSQEADGGGGAGERKAWSVAYFSAMLLILMSVAAFMIVPFHSKVAFLQSWVPSTVPFFQKAAEALRGGGAGAA